MKSSDEVYFGIVSHRFRDGADTWSSLERRIAGMISCNVSELKACLIGCTHASRFDSLQLFHLFLATVNEQNKKRGPSERKEDDSFTAEKKKFER